MRNQVSIYTKLSNKYNIPYPIIEVICNSPFRFTNSVISDLDPKPVRFSYLGKFKLKKRYEVENNKPLYSSFSKEMKRLYNKVDELINEGVITYEDFTNDVIDSITTTIVDNGKNNAEPSRADQVNAMCDMLFKKYEEYKKVEHTGGDREVLVDNIELSDETQLRESERANETC